jgi:ABC-type transport system involved in multi-copper enzyme maturation permease subunit
VSELAIARGDLRARFGTRKGVAVQGGLALVVYLATLLGVSSDAEGAVPSQVLGSVSTAILIVTVYVAAAMSSGEIAAPGEKGLVDLAVSPFRPDEIACGKAIASAVFAFYLALAMWPGLLFLHALRDGDGSVAVAQAAVVAAVAWGFAGIGTWLSGAVEGDLVRWLASWGLLLFVFGFLPLLGAPAFQPVLAVQPDAPALLRGLCVVSWLVIGALAFWGSARRVPALR